MNLQEMLQHEFLSGAPLPKTMPVSTLVCPPQDNFAYPYLLPEKMNGKANTVFSPTPKSTQKHSAIKQMKSIRGEFNSAQKCMKSPNVLARTDSQ